MIGFVIQGQMGVIRASCFMFLVILLFGSLMVSSEDWREREELFLSKLVDPTTGEVDQSMVELLHINCRVDLTQLKEAFEDLNSCLVKETPGSTLGITPRSRLSANEEIQKLNDELHLNTRQSLLDCIRKNNLLFHVARGERSLWYTNLLEPSVPEADAHRRNLGAQVSRSMQETLSPGPTPAPALTPAPAPGPAYGRSLISPSLSPDRRPRSRDPNAKSPRSSGSNHFFPSPNSGENSSNSGAGGNVAADKKSDNHITIIIAVAITAAVTFILAALLFFCCNKFMGRSKVSKKDERPLLSLSMNDYSVGSGNSIKDDKLRPMDESATFAAVAKSSALNGQPPLPPPPGRVGSGPPGMPPLKPPPGRAQPLPPEPPASARGPPPPPPPVPRLVRPSAPAPPSPRPPPPPMAPGPKPGPPPPPPKAGPGPPRPPPPLPGRKGPRPPIGSKTATSSAVGAESEDSADNKTKLKPFFWDKVMANPDHSMVWHQIKAGSFQFNEEMIETLFGTAHAEKNKNAEKKESSFLNQVPQFVQILDPKKAQNLSIMLKALNVTTDEVCDALVEGNELPAELLQTLLKMAPTADEELKLRLYNGEISQLGPAERFLKAMVDIPFAFKRMDALLFMCTLQEEHTFMKESFETLEVACKELRNSRLFLKLLEAVLKTGNRMNDGTYRGGAQAFKLDTLLKLSDVKGADGKTTLLHFVVQEIIRSEGLKAARRAKENRSFSSVKTDDLLEEATPEADEHYLGLGLEVVSRLSTDLANVKKAAALDADNITGTVARLGRALLKTREFLNSEMKSSEEDSGFHQNLKSFVQNAEADVMWLLEEEKRIMALVKSTGDYFHGNTAGKDEGLRLFVIVRDFLIILDKACREVREKQKKSTKALKKESSNASTSSETRRQPSDNMRQKLFPAIAERRMDDFSSDEDNP